MRPPFVGDFDEDGKNDLLVGQYVYGKLRIYRNVGTNVQPKFDGFEWFTVGGLPACVPAGCNVGFTPHLIDFDGDGRTDILTGSFPGVHFLFRRNSDGTFAQGEVLRDKHGEIQFGYPERHRYNSTVFAHDWDQDGDLDLLLDYNFSLVPNEGSRVRPVWGDAVPLEINGQRVLGGIVPPCAADWDGDGRDDLIIGRGSDIVWYRNVGEKGRPVLATPEVLVPDMRAKQEWEVWWTQFDKKSFPKSSTDDPQPLGHHARACHQWQGSLRRAPWLPCWVPHQMLPRSSTNSIPRSSMARTC